MKKVGFASLKDYEICRRIHKTFGTTYYYATMRFPGKYRRRVHAIYGFVRVPDEWVDNPNGLSVPERRQLIENWREQMVQGLAGKCPEHPAMRAFCDTVMECGIPVEEAHTFIDAMSQDLEQTTYETYEDLRDYMRGSASAIGVMMCYAMDAPTDPDTIARAKALGEAMQLTNFLRDIREDLHDRGRIYLPQEDLVRFGVTKDQLLAGTVDCNFKSLIQFEIERTRDLYKMSDIGIYKLPKRMRKAVLMARILYSDILGEIEKQGYNVFTRRARTSRGRKVRCALKVAVRDEKILLNLVNLSGVIS